MSVFVGNIRVGQWNLPSKKKEKHPALPDCTFVLFVPSNTTPSCIGHSHSPKKGRRLTISGLTTSSTLNPWPLNLRRRNRRRRRESEKTPNNSNASNHSHGTHLCLTTTTLSLSLLALTSSKAVRSFSSLYLTQPLFMFSEKTAGNKGKNFGFCAVCPTGF